MTLIPGQAAAILEAQWRVLWNKLPRAGGGSFAFGLIFSLIWYGMVAAGGVMLALYLPEVKQMETLQKALRIGFLVGFIYWLVIPLALVTTGMSLDLKRLQIYPIPPRQLFSIEVLLRVTTAVEVILLLAGAAVGLARHPLLAWWSPFTLLLFAVFNSLLSVGLRDLLGRLLQRKWIRELLVIVFVVGSVLPQWLARGKSPQKIGQAFGSIPDMPWPWTLTANLATGHQIPAALGGLLLWILVAWLFARWQFSKGMNTDMAEVRAAERPTGVNARPGFADRLFRLPGRLLPDPLGALVEKELRTLSRSSRFRLVFLMGFTFGLVIWLPIIFDQDRRPGFFTDNFLVMVTLYAALLLGEVLFWNCFGFDRQAAQMYFVTPVNLHTVLMAKNVTAIAFLMIEVGAVTAVCLILPFQLPWIRVAEAFVVTLVWGFLLLAVGNLASSRYPKGTNPTDSWKRAGNAKVGLLLLFLYPVLMLPFGLAFLARYAFKSEPAFFAVLGVNALLGAIVYFVALDSSVRTIHNRREEFLSALAQGDSPMG